MTNLVPESFSLDVIGKVIHPVKPSTEETYNKHYEKFRGYIISKVGPNACFRLSLVVEFFNHLANSNFRSSTLKSIRSVLRVPLQRYFHGYDIVADQWVDRIIQYVKRRKIFPTSNFPSWDLNIVVRMLTLRTDQDSEFIFKKTFFLTFLACPYRISEFKAISISRSTFTPRHILLKTHPSYFSKTQTDNFSPTPIVIPAYPEEPIICPVSLLNNYVHLTSSLCARNGIPRPDQLWLSLNLKPITLHLMRKWVRDIIFLGDPSATMSGTNAHSIRGQVATHLLAAGLDIKEILSAMNWTSPSTFTRYYAMLGIQASVPAVLAGHRPSS